LKQLVAFAALLLVTDAKTKNYDSDCDYHRVFYNKPTCSEDSE